MDIEKRNLLITSLFKELDFILKNLKDDDGIHYEIKRGMHTVPEFKDNKEIGVMRVPDGRWELNLKINGGVNE